MAEKKKLNVQELATASITGLPDKAISRKGLAMANSDYLAYRDIVTNITVKNAYSEEDYYNFREGEALPTTPKGIMCMGMKYYKTNPIVKNTIDTMAEFSASGMVINHKSERVQKLYRNHMAKIKSYSINEQFVRILLKSGAAVVNRSFAKIKKAELEDMYLGLAEDQEFPKIVFKTKEIPVGYSFLNPLHVNLPQEDISMFMGKKNYFLDLPRRLVDVIKRMTKEELEEFANEFPPEIAKELKQGKTQIPLDPYKVSIYNYKKDDFEVWGEPIHACILDDLVHYDKVKLADKTTLDSIASRIRLWKVGHLDGEYSFLPGEEAYTKLNDILASIPSGGVADIVWNPGITVEELSKDAHLFLTPEKYRSPLNAIYQGLGVPRTSNDDNSFNNNYFGLKTMVERLNYARNILKDFWTEELKVIHLALGLPGEPPVVMFDEISITNKEQMLALVRDMVDRNLISDEEGRRIFNTDPEIEAYRTKKEERRRKAESVPMKSGPYHNPNLDSDLKKVALQKGLMTPEDVGLETSLSKKDIMDIVKPKPAGVPTTKSKGKSGQGRPKNSADKSGRKKRIVKPRSAMATVWYKSAQDKVHDILLGKALEKFGKKNQRQLATAETDKLEKEKFALLYNLSFGSEIDAESINGVSTILPEEVNERYNTLMASFVKHFGRQPNIDEQRLLQIEVCMEKVDETNI
jgi:hypothetical protein